VSCVLINQFSTGLFVSYSHKNPIAQKLFLGTKFVGVWAHPHCFLNGFLNNISWLGFCGSGLSVVFSCIMSMNKICSSWSWNYRILFLSFWRWLDTPKWLPQQTNPLGRPRPEAGDSLQNPHTWCQQVHKAFFSSHWRKGQVSNSVGPGKLFQTSLIFVDKTRSLPKVLHSSWLWP